MVSLKTKESTQSMDMEIEMEKPQYSQVKPNIDLICVIDVSESMKGEKIDNVKKALKYLLELLGENDRICLITFNHKGVRLCPL